MSRVSELCFFICVIIFAVWGFWAGLELTMYGEVQPRAVDDIITVILIASLTANYKHWMDRRDSQ